IPERRLAGGLGGFRLAAGPVRRPARRVRAAASAGPASAGPASARPGGVSLPGCPQLPLLPGVVRLLRTATRTRTRRRGGRVAHPAVTAVCHQRTRRLAV